ncbi:integral membrane [Purpureocillium lavendulum]|uniref:Integral membrane n=1 Tax=Purpureocillium lavendulum TaxID=1247861 RepID=A0AB34FHX7_9HYPO|nr:integral membrane [Purpureocillium lavendulum]
MPYLRPKMTSEHTKTEEEQQASFKEQLDRIAVASREGDAESKPNPIIEKITEYIPGASAILGGGSHQQQQSPEDKKTEIPGPPNRPDHDDKIEEFVRDQHRSNKGDGDLNPSKGS